MTNKLQRVNTSDRVLEQLQTNVERALTNLVDSQTLLGIKLVAGATNVVPHGLGRRLVGWTLTRKRASADVWDVQDTNKSPDLTLCLQCDVNVTVDLEVF